MMALGLSSPWLWQHFLRHCAGRSEVGALSGTPLCSIGNYLHHFPTRGRELFPAVVKDLETVKQARYPHKPAHDWLSNVLCESHWLLDEGAAVVSPKSTLRAIEDHGLGAAVSQKLEISLQQVAQEHDIGEAAASMESDESGPRTIAESDPEGTPNVPYADDSKTSNQNTGFRALVATVVSTPWLSLDTGLFFMTLYRHNEPPLEAEWAGHGFDVVSERQW
ncbi:hypothetical protein IF1G_03374 [Cordyceps javanica]|uniref:Uncharacterized protein n=1 Tax=Cordyceps javanica TaxID=43265 RepID=A0A545V7E2_9HYPO|nr:hypothetical protein IF1G_03374 [Cordyceps javanica]